jgi:hypothetical protein
MFFKKTKQVLKCYTKFAYVAKHFPIELAKKQVPESFTSMPTHMKMPANFTACPFSKLVNSRKGLTIRSCDGILDLWSKSFVLCAPFDMAINIQDNRVQFKSTDNNLFPVSQHPEEQFSSVFPDYANVKMVIPWKFVSDKSMPCMFAPAIYHMPEDIRSSIMFPSGIVDYSIVHSTNINMLIKKQAEQKVIHIKAGTPLIYITPLTNEPIDVKIETLSADSWSGLENQNISFKSIYKFLKKKNIKTLIKS